MTYAVLGILPMFNMTVSSFSLSAPQSLRDRITETLCHNNKSGSWNENHFSILGGQTPIQLYNLLRWIKASGWVIVQVYCEEYPGFRDYHTLYLLRRTDEKHEQYDPDGVRIRHKVGNEY
jgi:beta-glucanase (GH16 family)